MKPHVDGYEEFNKIPTRNVLLFVIACHGGSQHLGVVLELFEELDATKTVERGEEDLT